MFGGDGEIRVLQEQYLVWIFCFAKPRIKCSNRLRISHESAWALSRLRKQKIPCGILSAETERFELSRGFKAPASLAKRYIRPL